MWSEMLDSPLALGFQEIPEAPVYQDVPEVQLDQFCPERHHNQGHPEKKEANVELIVFENMLEPQKPPKPARATSKHGIGGLVEPEKPIINKLVGMGN